MSFSPTFSGFARQPARVGTPEIKNDMPSFAPDSSVVSGVTPSPNFNARKDGRAPDMIVLHYTGTIDAQSAINRLTTAGTNVSAHYVVLEDGSIIQCVKEDQRAWHAGPSSWSGETDINSSSIGIEIVNGGHDLGHPDFALRQVAAVIALCKGITLRRQIPKQRVLAHSDIAPGRIKNPGEKFPWRLLAASGVGHWVEPAPIVRSETRTLGASGEQVLSLQRALASYGYAVLPTGQYDGATMDAVAAFQRHFRPERVDGIADHSTLTTLRQLIETLPKVTEAADFLHQFNF